mgnify:FL=1
MFPSSCPLFQDIRPDEYEQMMRCFHAHLKSYRAGQLISTYDSDSRMIGVVLSGEASLVRQYRDGRQLLVERLLPGSVFGEVLSYVSPETGALQVFCVRDASIQYLDYPHLIKRCPKACAHHSQLVSNTIQLLSGKAVEMSERLEILSQRNIHDKLVCCFLLLAAKNGRETQSEDSLTFTLPFSLSTLADYIGADRSAMMREIRKMKDSKELSIVKRTVHLRKPDGSRLA